MEVFKKYWKERLLLRYQHSFRNATRGAKILVICFYLATEFFFLKLLIREDSLFVQLIEFHIQKHS